MPKKKRHVETRRVVRSTGIKIPVATDQNRRKQTRFDELLAIAEHRQQHFWLVVSAFHVTIPDQPCISMDTENLMTIEGPGCYICEQVYEPGISPVCPGNA